MRVGPATPVGAIQAPGTPQARDPAQIAKAGRDFESMTLDQMLQPMFQTIDSTGGMFGEGPAEQTLKPLLVTEFAKMMEARGGIGLAAPISSALAQQTRIRS